MTPVTLGERIKEALENAKPKKLSVADAAEKIGVRHSAIYPWLSGKTKNLKLENLYALADATGYSAKWIAIEAGTKREIKALAGNEVDISFLTTTIQAVEKHLDEEDLELQPETKAKLVSLLYEICADKGKVEKPVVAKYLRLVV